MKLLPPPPTRKDMGSLWVFALLASLLIATQEVGAAQSHATGISLTGIVRDTTGLVLPGATVELALPAAPTRSTVSAADGTFVFPDVSGGSYRLQVTFPDFQSFDQMLTVDANPPRPLIVVLGLSGLQEHVSVVAP
jgi:hypothetical protein